ncbi:MAG TPA: LCP family protein [Candidatus Woesebacteria bacterium]|nr:LCP family protein [Candidatus Woesebacteria bacterium]
MKKVIFLFYFIFTLIFTSLYLGLFQLAKITNKRIDYFPKLVINTLQNKSTASRNILVLGLDPRDDKIEKTNTTDTIMLAKVSSKDLRIISIPRDLWVYSLSKKVNQIYELSQTQTDRYQYLKTNFEKLTNQKIDNLLIITSKNLIDIIKIVGGVDVQLEIGFKDTQYPNPEYIKNPNPNIPIYKTVEFKSGLVHLDETNVVEFVRSRHGAETAALNGTDLGRINRQQLLINALQQKLLNLPKNINSLKILLNLYNYYSHSIETDLEDQQLFSLAYQLLPNLDKFSINKTVVPTSENNTTPIYHPNFNINGAWVFIPKEKNYQSLHNYINDYFKD